MEDIYDVDKDYKQPPPVSSRWLTGTGRSMDMSGSSHSSDSHGVYSAYTAGTTTVFSPLSCDNNSDYQQMESSRRRDKSCSKLKDENSPSQDNGSPKSAIEIAHKTIKEIAHSRTKSDITPTATGGSGKSSKTFSLSRSKSIASARDKWKISSSYGLLPFLSKENSKNNLNDSLDKSSDEHLRKESDNLRLRLNTETQERQRLEREVDRFVKLYDQCQDELHEMRDQQKQLLSSDGGPNESLSIMYSNLLRKYEAGNEEYNKLLVSHNDVVNKSEQYQEQLKQYKNSYENILNERNKYKQQCTQAIRQWDQVLVEKNQLKIELDQAMNIRIKASKDIKRLTEERNSALHEYSVIMSERESVHKEMEKLQEDLHNKAVMSKEIELLQREIRAALSDRDKAMKEVHEMKRKLEDKENSDPSTSPTNSDTKTLNKAMEEIRSLKQENEDLEEKLKNANMEADVAKGRRDWAFSERDKIMLESEGVQALCDRLRKERDKAMTELIDKIKELNDVKNQTKINQENIDNEQKFKIAKHKDNFPNTVKIIQIDQKLDSSKFHGIILDEGVYVRALTNNSVFARNNTIQVGDKILQINNINVRDDIFQARNVLNKNDSLSLTIERETQSKTGASNARKESDEKRSDFVSKMIQKSESDSKPVPKLFTSSERVYSISSTPTHSATKKPWTHFKENVKGKLDLVKGRRQSAEQADDEEKVDYCLAPEKDRGEKIKQGEIKDVETMLKNHHLSRKTSDSESDSVDGEYKKYSIENLDNKIMEMKQNFAAPQTPVNCVRAKLLNPHNPRPEDVVQSHYRQVQSRIQDTLASSKHQSDANKDDYFLASSASETSLNESLKSGNLDEHEVVFQDQLDEKSGTSIPDEDPIYNDKFSKSGAHAKYKEVFQFAPGSSSGLEHHKQTTSSNVTSPKRTSPFPAVKVGPQPNVVYQDPHQLYSSLYQYPPPPHPGLKSPTGPGPHAYSPSMDQVNQRHPSAGYTSRDSRQNSTIYNLYTGNRQLPHVPHQEQRFSSLPPDVPGAFSRLSYPSSLGVNSVGIGSHNRLSLASNGNRLSVASFGQYHPLTPTETDLAASQETLPAYGSREKPQPGDIRQFHVEKSGEQLGIRIEEVNIRGEMAGIFISRVTVNSLAARIGLHIGDQLLEVGGINLRTAKYTQAAQVLQTHIGKSVDIKVQYNPDKFEMGDNCNSAESLYGYTSGCQTSKTVSPMLGYSKELSPSVPMYKSTPIRSESQSNFYTASSKTSPFIGDGQMDDPKSKSSTLKSALNLDLLPAAHSTVIANDDDMEDNDDNIYHYGDNGSTTPNYSSRTYNRFEPRLLKPILRKSGVLGVRLVGGNRVGIFIHSIESQSSANDVGLQRGDQILEYNGIDLRTATAEQAAYELAQPVEKVRILVQFNPDRYREIKDSPGDSYFIRAMFDRTDYDKEPTNALQLVFSKDDILWVDNTIYNGVPGNWSAWILDKDGNKVKWGLIPSKYKVEESLRKRNKGKTFSDGVYEFSNSTRRSFLRKIKGNEPGLSSNSMDGDIKELAVYSDVESLKTQHDEERIPQLQPCNYSGYLRVEKRSFNSVRPVLILGPFAGCIVEKLSKDHPSKYVQCLPEYMNSDLKTVEKGVADNIFIDYKKRGSHFECTTLRSIKEIITNNQHSFLDVNINAVEKLQQSQIYPIVLLIKFKSVKQLKEVNFWDPRSGYQQDQPNMKDARNMHEHSLKLEQDYKHLISDVVQAGANLMLLCAQVSAKIDVEQKRPIWIPSGTIW